MLTQAAPVPPVIPSVSEIQEFGQAWKAWVNASGSWDAAEMRHEIASKELDRVNGEKPLGMKPRPENWYAGAPKPALLRAQSFGEAPRLSSKTPSFEQWHQGIGWEKFKSSRSSKRRASLAELGGTKRRRSA